MLLAALGLGGAGGAVAAGLATARKRYSTRGQVEVSSTMWNKMRRHMEAMPEDFPPRVMFDNVAAAKANTEQILHLLQAGGASDVEPVTTS